MGFASLVLTLRLPSLLPSALPDGGALQASGQALLLCGT